MEKKIVHRLPILLSRLEPKDTIYADKSTAKAKKISTFNQIERDFRTKIKTQPHSMHYNSKLEKSLNKQEFLLNDIMTSFICFIWDNFLLFQGHN